MEALVFSDVGQNKSKLRFPKMQGFIYCAEETIFFRKILIDLRHVYGYLCR
jgi:hypothetical protein